MMQEKKKLISGIPAFFGQIFSSLFFCSNKQFFVADKFYNLLKIFLINMTAGDQIIIIAKINKNLSKANHPKKNKNKNLSGNFYIGVTNSRSLANNFL